MGKQRGKREGDLGFRGGAVVGGFGGLDGLHASMAGLGGCHGPPSPVAMMKERGGGLG